MRAWLPLLALLAAACSSPPDPPRPCSSTLPCPAPLVCHPVEKVCVSARDGGWSATWELGAPDTLPREWRDPRLLEAQPPGKPNWTDCTLDAECESRVCGCNVTLPKKQCLPSALYPRDCGWPNWTSCTVDSDCASHWCGCNGGTLRQCLPSTAYPKTCT
jgi:hypothetical protein